jgi:hypothetical protein
VLLNIRLLPGELVHQKIQIIFYFANDIAVSSIAVFSVSDRNTPIYLLCGEKMIKYVNTIRRR